MKNKDSNLEWTYEDAVEVADEIAACLVAYLTSDPDDPSDECHNSDCQIARMFDEVYK